MGDNMSESMGEYISESMGGFVGIGTRNALIFVAGNPIGFVVPYLNPSDQQFVRIDSAPFPPAEATRVVTSLSAGVPLRLLTNISISSRGWPDVAARLRSLGLAVEPDACRAISSPIQATIALCEVRKTPSARTADTRHSWRRPMHADHTIGL
jgi:hypothetical protein